MEPSAVVIVNFFPSAPVPTAKLCTPPLGTSVADVICPLSLNVKTGILDAVPTVAPVTTLVNFAEAIAPVAIDA